MTIMVAPILRVRVREHDGPEMAIGRRGNVLAVLLPTGSPIEDIIERFRNHLDLAELRALYATAVPREIAV